MKKIFILVCITIISFNAKSYYNFDFSAICNTGQTLYYKIYGNNTVGVTYPQYGEHNNDYTYYYGFSRPTGHVIIPDSVLYNSVWYKVTKITNCAFCACTGLTSITIPNSVTSIGEWAFSHCTSLTSITIPNSVTSIGEYAFSGCTSLTSITIPNSVTSIGSSAFIGCTSLTSITIPNSVASIGESAFYNCTGLTSITLPDSITHIENSTFKNCTGLTSITIPNSVTSIGDYAFYECTSLTSITLPNSVTSIEGDAFFNCTNLTSITIPNSVTSIGNYAFEGCNNITTLNYNAKNCITYNDAFKNKTSLTTLTIGDSVQNIPNSFVYGCTGLTSVTIGNSVTSIGSIAFYGCNNITTLNYNAKNCITYNDAFKNKTSLETLTIGDSVQNIPNNFVYGCTGLTSVTIGNSVTSIENYTFSGCTSLTSITLPNSVTNIEGDAFFNCTNLTSITIPNSVTSIGSGAFYGCTSLTSITLPDSITHIENNTFKNCTGLTSITIPNSVTSIGSSAFYECTSLTSITLPNSVTNIEGDAFFNCTNLTSITIPNSVTSIGSGAFYGCTSLTSITLPNSVTSIGDYAFQNCINLISIEIGKDLTYMGSYVFKNCNNISVVEWNAKNCVAYNDAFVDKTNISILNIGDSVIKIPNNFVKQCSGLIFVTVGENVSNIGNSAFADCNNIDVLNWNAKNCIIYNDAFVNKINITVLNIGDSVEIIPNNFLKGCTKLPSVILPPSVAHIGYSAFENCIKLKIPILPDSLSYVGNNAFRKCRLLDNRLVIPQNVNYIGNYAFDSCSLISSIVMKGNPPTIFANTFNTISNSTPIFVPCGKVDDYYAVYFWSNFTNIQESQPYEFEVFSEDTIKGIVNIIKTPTCSDNNAKILALNNNGYIFSSWSDGSNDNPKEFTVYSDTILTAYFVPITPIISVVSNDSTKGLVTGSGEYVYMQSINISATAKSYYHFVSWNDGNTENPRTIIVTQDSSFTAIFISDTCDVFVISNNELAGNVYGGGTFLYQNTITISATPNEHYHFVSWNDGSIQNPRQITVEQDTSFVALFEIDTHFVATSVNDESYGQVADGGVYDYGTPITLIANATTGYHFTQWNDGNTENPRNIVVTQDTSFVAWFEIDTFFVDVSANDVSFGSTSGSGVYDWSSEVVISATPNEHYHFVQWQDGNTSNPRLVTITKDTSFVAIFQEDTRYTLQVVSNNQTMGTVEGAGEYYEGETISIKATANEHYHFSQWSDGNTDNPRLVTVISDNTFIANFAKDIYTVSVESENVTMGTVYGAGEYEYQDVVEIYAVAYAGYKFLQWNDENTDNPRQINVLQNATYIANFIIDDGVGLEAKEKDDFVVSLYPNPTTSNATLLVKGLTEEATIMVTDQAGRVISTTTLALGQETMEVETSKLASGVYYIRIQTANSVRTEKLIRK